MNRDNAPRSPLDLLYEEAVADSYATFREEMPKAMLFPKKDNLRRYALRRGLDDGPQDGLIMELGVAGGLGIRVFAEILARRKRQITGFDSFVGLEEDWTGHHRGRQKGSFGQKGVLPEVPDNVTLVEGWIQDTLPPFLEDTAPTPVSFVHMDMDTYTPTAFALGALRGRLKKGTVILFDELYGYPGWREHEWKALGEALSPKSYTYIGFSHEAIAIQMLKAA